MLFRWPDLKPGGGRAVFIVGTIAHSLDSESVTESSMYIPTTSDSYSPSRKPLYTNKQKNKEGSTSCVDIFAFLKMLHFKKYSRDGIFGR